MSARSSGSGSPLTKPKLSRFVAAVLAKKGLSLQAARIVSDVLVEADLRGIPSHGLERLPTYLDRLSRGLINPKPKIKLLRDRGSLLLIDGDNGMGPFVATTSMLWAVQRARETGLAGAVVRNSNHFGIAAYYAEVAARNGMIGVSTSNSFATMAIWGGTSPVLGTNPFAFSIPMGRDERFSADWAMSKVARGKIILASQRHERLPPNLAIGKNGRPTRDAQRALAGAVLPFGEFKGSALAILIEVFCGPLAGGKLSKEIGSLYDLRSQPQGIGHFFLAINVSALTKQISFTKDVKRLVTYAKLSAPKREMSDFRLPGDRSQSEREQRLSHGIVLPQRTLKRLRQAGAEVNLFL